MNQYEIDFQQGYDTANDEWLDKVKQAREDIKECSFMTTLHSDDYFMGIDKVEFVRLDIVCKILDKLIAESDEK